MPSKIGQFTAGPYYLSIIILLIHNYSLDIIMII